MEIGLAQCVNKGMQRDYSMDKASQEFAYENKNIRITTTGNESFLSVTNEKSTTPINVHNKKFNPIKLDTNGWIYFEYPVQSDITITVESDEIEDERYDRHKKYNVIVKKGEVSPVNIGFGYGEADLHVVSFSIKGLKSDEFYYYLDLNEYPASDLITVVDPFKGVVLGHAIIGEKLILFTKGDKDYIYRMVLEDHGYKYTILYQGDLNFDLEHPIECLPFYESDNVQKIYWVDGKNQPRVINICNIYPSIYNFDFTPNIDSNFNISIEKQYEGSGNFTSGVIQYYITAYKKYGPESNLIYQSPLYYISPNDRGGEPGESQSCSFKISISTDLNSEYDYLKVYSIIRTSLNTEVVASIVNEVSLNNKNNVVIIDTNKGTPIAPTDIMFLGGNTIIANTIEQKDNALFLGNVTTKSNELNDTKLKKLIKNIGVSFIRKKVKNNLDSNNEYYNYTPNMDSSSFETTTFKYLEWYRFGIQFQLNTGEWTATHYIGDFQNTLNPTVVSDTDEVINPFNYEDDFKYLTAVKAILPEELVTRLKSFDIINWRLTVAEHTPNTRTIKAQGLVLPTIFNIKDRDLNIRHNIPMWNIGQCQYGIHNTNIDIYDSKKAKLVSSTTSIDELSPLNSLPYGITGDTILNNTYGKTQVNNEIIRNITLRVFVKRVTDNIADSWLYEYGMKDVFGALIKVIILDKSTNISKEYTLSASTNEGKVSNDSMRIDSNEIVVYNSRLYGQRKKGFNNLSSKLKALKWEAIKDYYIKGYLNEDGSTKQVKDLFLDTDIQTLVFKDGEIPSGKELRDEVNAVESKSWTIGQFMRKYSYTLNEELINNHKNEYFLDASICNFVSPEIDNVKEGMQFRLIGSTDIQNSISDYRVEVEDPVVETTKYEVGIWNFNNNKYKDYFTGINSYPLWPFSNRLHYLYYWNQDDAIIKTNQDDNNGSDKDTSLFKLKTKKFANMWYFGDTTMCEHIQVLNYSEKISNLEVVGDNDVIINNNLYSSKYENLLTPINENSISIKRNEDNTDGINTSFPLDVINSILNEDSENFKKLTRDKTNTIINYKSTKHIVFQLPKINANVITLPNYNAECTSEYDVFGEKQTNYITLQHLFYPSVKDIDENSIVIANESVIEKLDNNTIDNLKVSYDKYPTLDETSQLYSFQFKDNNNKILFSGLGSDTARLSNNDNIINSYGDYKIVEESKFTNNDYVGIVIKSKELKEDKIIIGQKYEDSLINCFVLPLKLAMVKLDLDEDTYYLNVLQRTISKYPINTIFKATKFRDRNIKYWIGEFYIPYDEISFMGGKEDAVLEQQVFLPVNGIYTLNDNEESIGYGLEGDTYYSRWDYVRILPNEDEINQNTDALSIMIESHNNLDADYRQLRGRLDTTVLTEENTNNVLNPVYNQPDNYITSSVLNEKFDDSTHSTLYTWSLAKTSNTNVDTWTSINLVRSNKLDGDKGVLTKLKRWNNQLLAFQEKGISVINYNQQTTISNSEGVPIEIAASGNVTGHYYITSTQGCKNKWSITESPSGLYFIDSYNKSINSFSSDGLKSLSTIYLFQDWTKDNEKGLIWNPTNNGGFKSFYDSINHEVYFVNDKTALCFNELLSQFTSFYDYERLNTLVSINNSVYGIKDSQLHKMFEGNDYCNLFGENVEYSMTYKINKDSFKDKTWTNIEYRADIFSEGDIQDIPHIDESKQLKIANETFDKLEVWNEYQYGISTMNKAKPKFRIWRENIPRDIKEGKGFNRIRNPWIMLKLSKSNSNKRMEFHDLLIKYLQ